MKGIFEDNEAEIIRNYAQSFGADMAVNFIQMPKDEQKGAMIAVMTQSVADLDSAMANLDAEKTQKLNALKSQQNVLNAIITKMQTL